MREGHSEVRRNMDTSEQGRREKREREEANQETGRRREWRTIQRDDRDDLRETWKETRHEKQ